MNNVNKRDPAKVRQRLKDAILALKSRFPNGFKNQNSVPVSREFRSDSALSTHLRRAGYLIEMSDGKYIVNFKNDSIDTVVEAAIAQRRIANQNRKIKIAEKQKKHLVVRELKSDNSPNIICQNDESYELELIDELKRRGYSISKEYKKITTEIIKF